MSKPSRKRGVILTHQGQQKIEEARRLAETRDNYSDRYTYEELSQLTNLSLNTVIKIMGYEVPVDKQSLDCFFTAFNIVLERGDYTQPNNNISAPSIPPPDDRQPTFPGDPLTIDSLYYINRFLNRNNNIFLEERCYEEILKPHSLIRIKAPKLMGKTSLMKRILDRAEREINSRIVRLNFLEAAQEDLNNLDSFLRWFCISIAYYLDLDPRLDNFWHNPLPKSLKCTDYFQKYLLPQINSPLVLGLDEVNRLLPYEQVANDFFALLRSWHEKGKKSSIWQKLRLVVAHSTDIYIQLRITQSPFNVGVPIELPEFTVEQVLELANCYSLDWNKTQALKLMEIIGGHPYLVHLALYSLERQEISLENLLFQAIYTEGIYGNHLQRLLEELRRINELTLTYKKVVNKDDWIEIEEIEAHNLYRLGLVKRQEGKVKPSCNLYRQYFQRVLSHEVVSVSNYY